MDFAKKRSISIDDEKCIKCGLCIKNCTQKALDYNDDTKKFFEDLQAGKEIVVAIDPAFYFDYPKQAQNVLSYLQKKGVKAFYNVSYGNDLSIWTYAHWLRMHKNQSAIISMCGASVSYMEQQHPHLLKYLAPVKTGLLCLATYLKKYRGEKRDIAYISPCMGISDRVNMETSKLFIRYNVTFNHLFKEIENKLPKPGTLAPVKLEIGDYGFGSLLSISGSLKRALEYYVGLDRPFIEVQDAITLFPSLKNLESYVKGTRPNIAIVSNCNFGCVFGTGTDIDKIFTADIYSIYSDKRKEILSNPEFVCDVKTPEAQLRKLDKHFAGININDFLTRYTEHYIEPSIIPEDVYDEIFSTMHKITEKSRNMNCQACGYETCRNMVTAIAKGQNQIENCIQYDRVEKAKLLTTNINTNLPNIQIFYRDLEELIEEKKLAGKTVIRFHINGILLINQLFGFDVGTDTLIEFAKKTLEHLAIGEKLYQNTGPDFYAILQKEHVNKFIFTINNLELSTLVKVAPDFSGLKVNCGVYNFTGKETKLGTILNNMTVAYRFTKNKTAARVASYDSSMNDQLIRSMITAQRIPQALEKKEFSIMFQPKVSAINSSLIGAEALIRWTHGDTIISPSEFIEIAENSGYIKQIDFLMLTEACKHISMWRGIGMESVRISVNFSKEHFQKAGIAKRICSVVDSMHVPHHCIEIEITESSFLDDLDNIKNGIIELHKNGIKTAIDDFGTGYSSISLLSILPFDVIKFDKTIMDTVEAGTRAETVVRNIIRLAKDLKMEVVAEGIDKKERLELLKNMGCDIIQGYIFDKPLTPQDFLKRLAHPKYA